jgi:hypothetical protein
MKTLGSLALRFAICIAVTWIGVAWLGLIGLATTAPIWAVMFVKPILEFFPAIERMIHRQALEPWEGKYYKYERTHLRVHFDGGDAWFVADDVLSVLGKKRGNWLDTRFGASEYRLIPGRMELGFTPEAVLKLIDMSEHPEARKFRLWFERAVVFTLNRKKEMREASGSA